MKKNLISLLIVAILTLILGSTAIYGSQDFSISPSSSSETLNISTLGGGSFSVTNIGNETTSLSITKVDLTGSAGPIILNLGTTSISNLGAGNSSNVAFTYSSGTTQGTSTGTISVANTANSSQIKTFSVTVIVSTNGGVLSIDNVTTTIKFRADVDDTDDVRLKFRNIGNLDLTNIDLQVVDDFQGIESGDEIRDKNFDFDDDKKFDLKIGKRKTIKFIVDVPRDVSADIYEGVVIAKTDQGDFTWDVEIEVDGGNDDVTILDNSRNVKDGVLELSGEPGDNLDNYEFIIDNNGNTDFQGITFRVDGDLREEFTSSTIPASAVTFNPTSSDVNKGDNDDIEVKVNVPDDTASGDYFADIEIFDSTGDKLDNIILKVKINGDVYIKDITYNKGVGPGERLNVDVTVKNKGSKIFRNVKIEATLFDVDEGTEDLSESSSTFLLDVGDEKTKTISFNVPDYVSDGGHTLEVRLNFGTQQVTEVEEIRILRPLHFLKINSASINPGVAKCVESIYTFLNAKNLGSNDETKIEVSAEIEGTNIFSKTTILKINENEKLQKSLTLPIESLDAGTYIVKHTLKYSGEEETRESTLIIAECRETAGIDIDDSGSLSNIKKGNHTLNDSSKVVLFGEEVGKTTVYLGTGIGVLTLLIVVSLFFL